MKFKSVAQGRWLGVVAVLAVAGTVILPAVDAFRVLGVFPFNGQSHNIMFKAMMEALADHGHEVVMLSPFPLKKARANYTDLDLSSEFPSLVNTLTFEQMYQDDSNGLGLGLDILDVIEDIAGAGLCRKVFAHKHFKDIMGGVHGKFDVVFTEIFGSDCWAAVAYKLKLPLISMVSAPDFTWAGARVGSVDNPSFIQTAFMRGAGKMNFLQRLLNVYSYVMTKYRHTEQMQEPSDAVVREFLGEDTPPITELVRRTSLVMANSHASMHPARPVNPNVIQVGGLHLRPPSAGLAALDAALPGLRAWMDGAEHGVIFFSLGSLVRSNTLPRERVRAFLDAFAALPQRVLWKYETDDVEGLPDNVRTASWLPQVDVLAHPKTILFITHGGLMGTLEAVDLGVPMLGMPMFADQRPNVELYRWLGVALRLDHTNVTKDTVLATIRELTETSKYRDRARHLAARFRDRPRTASEEAVWWTEYVVRHGGAPHLRPLGADMPLHEYLLLDVVAAVLGVILAALAAAALALRALLRALIPKRSKQKRN